MVNLVTNDLRWPNGRETNFEGGLDIYFLIVQK